VSWREFVASLVDSLAWPSAAVVLVVVLRRQLAGLLDGPLQRLKVGPGGLEAEWDRAERDTAVAAAKSIPIGSVNEEEADAVEQRLEALAPLVDSTPALVIRQAFDVIESELRHLVDGAGADLPYPNSDVHGYVKAAYHADLITKELGEAIRGLIVLRDLTNNDPGGTRTSAKQAQDFLSIARAVAYSLRTAAARLPRTPTDQPTH
jgi:hypothetical protein